MLHLPGDVVVAGLNLVFPVWASSLLVGTGCSQFYGSFCSFFRLFRPIHLYCEPFCGTRLSNLLIDLVLFHVGLGIGSFSKFLLLMLFFSVDSLPVQYYCIVFSGLYRLPWEGTDISGLYSWSFQYPCVLEADLEGPFCFRFCDLVVPFFVSGFALPIAAVSVISMYLFCLIHAQ